MTDWQTDRTRKAAVVDFLEVWTNDTLLEDIATSLTCKEADALADLLRAYNYETEATSLLSAHAEGDDEGDLHYDDGLDPDNLTGMDLGES